MSTNRPSTRIRAGAARLVPPLRRAKSAASLIMVMVIVATTSGCGVDYVLERWGFPANPQTPKRAQVDKATDQGDQEDPDTEFNDEFFKPWFALINLQSQVLLFAQQEAQQVGIMQPDSTTRSGFSTTQLDFGLRFDWGAAGDFDGDSETDLYAAGEDPDTGEPSGQFLWNESNDPDQFMPGPVNAFTSLPMASTFINITFADFDDDGVADDSAIVSRDTDTDDLAFTFGYASPGSGYVEDETSTLSGIPETETAFDMELLRLSGPHLDETTSRATSPPSLALALEWLDQAWILPNDGSGGFPDPNDLGDEHKYDVGLAPRAIAVGDLDGQSGPDLIVANSDSDDLSVLLGNGDGSYAAETRFAGESQPQDVELADFDNDGDLDVIAGNDGSVTFHANDGDGNLAAPVIIEDYGVSIVRYVYPRDFNGDGNIDIALRFSSGRDIDVLFGRGDGTIVQAPTLASSADVLTNDDLDGDTHPDLLFAARGSDSFDADIGVRFNNGDGTFGSEVTVNTNDFQDSPESIVAAEVTGDATPDVVLADSRGSTSTGGVAVYPNNGDGTFDDAILTLPPLAQAYGLAVADLDQTGPNDAAITSGNVTDGLYVVTLINNGDGSFNVGDEVQVNSALPENAIVIADLDDDGHNDIIAAQADAATPLNLLFNDGNGDFPDPPVEPAIDPDANAEARDVAVTDIDNDGDPDILVSATSATGACPPDITEALIILYNDGSGGFASPEIICGGTGSTIALADIEGDGNTDIYLADGSSFRIVTNRGGGAFVAPQVSHRMPIAASLTADAITAVDFDSDGVIDLAAGSDEIALAELRLPDLVFFDRFEMP